MASKAVSNGFSPVISKSVSVDELRLSITLWLMDSQYRQLAPKTLVRYRLMSGHLLWFVEHGGLVSVDKSVVQRFLLHVRDGHGSEGGRWGSAYSQDRQVKPSSVRTYYGTLKSLFGFMVAEGHIGESPVEGIAPPVVRQSQVQPLSEDQVRAILDAARRSLHAKRDTALILLLLDTGIRCNELTSLKVSAVDIAAKRCLIWGKGSKSRSVYFGSTTAKTLYGYIRSGGRQMGEESPLFLSVAGRWNEGGTKGIDNPGVLQLIKRLARDAGIVGTRCSPHSFRHTCAVMFLRNGGNVFALKEMLGHSNLNMTNRYVALANADVANQHRQFSPVDRMKK